MIGLPQNIVKEANKIIFSYIWKGKDKIKRTTQIADYCNGGLKMLDIESISKTQKVVWIKRFLNQEKHPWKIYLMSLLDNYGGVNLLNGNVNTKLIGFFHN